jgi:hypothetical protein
MATVELGTSRSGGPTWEIAHLFPNQGTWTVDDYLALNTNHLVEFSDGLIEILPMPTEQHQLLVASVDPRDQTITVLALERAARQYAIAGRYTPGGSARSTTLDGFTVDVSAAFSQS